MSSRRHCTVKVGGSVVVLVIARYLYISITHNSSRKSGGSDFRGYVSAWRNVAGDWLGICSYHG